MGFRRVVVVAAVLSAILFTACRSSSVGNRFDCSDEELVDWVIPAAWMDRELSPSEARVEVLNANLAKPSMEARWDELQKQRRDGDAYWLYRRTDEESRHALGVKRGVVLLRGCRQIGFVTTRIETEEHL